VHIAGQVYGDVARGREVIQGFFGGGTSEKMQELRYVVMCLL